MIEKISIVCAELLYPARNFFLHLFRNDSNTYHSIEQHVPRPAMKAQGVSWRVRTRSERLIILEVIS
jgi:hypothetical protein